MSTSARVHARLRAEAKPYLAELDAACSLQGTVPNAGPCERPHPRRRSARSKSCAGSIPAASTSRDDRSVGLADARRRELGVLCAAACERGDEATLARAERP